MKLVDKLTEIRNKTPEYKRDFLKRLRIIKCKFCWSRDLNWDFENLTWYKKYNCYNCNTETTILFHEINLWKQT